MSNRDQKQALVKGKFLMGIDIGKNKSWAIIRKPDGKLLKPISLESTHESLSKTLTYLQNIIGKNIPSKLVIGMEPTSVYWKPIAHFFEQKGIPLVLTSAEQTHIARKLDDNSPNKSDKRDARLITDLMASAKFMDCYMPKGVFANLRQLSSQKERLWRELQRHENYVALLIEQLFPEYKLVFPKPMAPSSRAILRHVCTPLQIREAGIEQLTKWIFQVWKHKKGARRKAEQIFERAEKHTGMAEGLEAIQLTIKQQFLLLDVLYAHQKQLDDELVIQLEQVKYAKYLLSIKDVGPISTARLLGEFGDFKNYQHPAQMHKMAGLNLYQITSGETEKDEKKIRRRITKKGRPRIRRILYYTALRAMQEHSTFHEYFSHMKSKGKPFGRQAMAFERKIIGIMHSLVHNEVMFDEEKWKQDRGGK